MSLILVFELLRMKVASLGLNDVRRQLQHVLRNLLVRNVVEVLGLLSHLVRISQRYAKEPLVARLQRDHVLARREDDPAECNHALLADCLADDRERLLADLAVRHEIVRAVEVQFVDLLLRYELVDLDRPLALDRYRLKLFGLDLDVLALADLVALDDLLGTDLVAGLGVDLSVLDPVAGVLVDLVEADLFSLAACRNGDVNGNRGFRRV
jgi:hypothetical protein